jgi:uncharacterized protein (TIGR02266 family)
LLKENRKHERIPSRLRVWCEGENVTFYARVDNLSEGGLFLKTSTPLTRGAKARLRIETEAQQIETNATVVWSRADDLGRPPGMGLKFDTIDADTLDRIRTIIQRERKSDLG